MNLEDQFQQVEQKYGLVLPDAYKSMYVAGWMDVKGDNWLWLWDAEWMPAKKDVELQAEKASEVRLCAVRNNGWQRLLELVAFGASRSNCMLSPMTPKMACSLPLRLLDLSTVNCLNLLLRLALIRLITVSTRNAIRCKPKPFKIQRHG